MKTMGINHIALVARDMAETVKFYTEVLQMPLVKTVELPTGGQHFFFDCGGGSAVAFFWWQDAPPAAPGVASVRKFPPTADARPSSDAAANFSRAIAATSGRSNSFNSSRDACRPAAIRKLPSPPPTSSRQRCRAKE